MKDFHPDNYKNGSDYNSCKINPFSNMQISTILAKQKMGSGIKYYD